MTGTNASRAAQFRPPRLGPPASELTSRGRELLDEIEAIFFDEGFARHSIDRLAARLHCSKGTLYDLAPTKDELVLVVIDRRLRRGGGMLLAELASLDDPVDRLAAFMRSELRHEPQRSIRFSEDTARHPAAARLIADHLRYALLTLQEIIEEGVASGRFRDVHPRMVAELVEATSMRVSDPEVLREAGLDFDQALRELCELVCAAVISDIGAHEIARRGPGQIGDRI